MSNRSHLGETIKYGLIAVVCAIVASKYLVMLCKYFKEALAYV